MSAPEVGRRRAGQRFGVGVGAVLLTGVIGCAGIAPAPTPVPTPAPTTTSSLPADGIGLATLGVRNGPTQFLLPRGTVASINVDQPNNVVLVLTAPGPAEVASYLSSVLPETGFLVQPGSADSLTFIFNGHGWSGNFTASGDTAAILLRPL